MEIDRDILKIVLQDICCSLNISVVPKDFQVDFMAKAILGLNGFLLVSS